MKLAVWRLNFPQWQYQRGSPHDPNPPLNINTPASITVSPAAITLTGNTVNLAYNRAIIVSPAAITLTGADVELIYTPIPSDPNGTNFGFYSDVQSVDDTRWKGVKEAREQAREAVEALDKPLRQKARKEAVKVAEKAVQATIARVETLPPAMFKARGISLDPLLERMTDLQLTLAIMVEQERIRQADIDRARQAWIEIDRQLVQEAFLEEELMIVLALTV
jgi:hypothetical protein